MWHSKLSPEVRRWLNAPPRERTLGLDGDALDAARASWLEGRYDDGRAMLHELIDSSSAVVKGWLSTGEIFNKYHVRYKYPLAVNYIPRDEAEQIALDMLLFAARKFEVKNLDTYTWVRGGGKSLLSWFIDDAVFGFNGSLDTAVTRASHADYDLLEPQDARLITIDFDDRRRISEQDTCEEIVMALPSEMRSTVGLASHLSKTEIASDLGLAYESVRSLFRRARVLLERRAQDEGADTVWAAYALRRKRRRTKPSRGEKSA